MNTPIGYGPTCARCLYVSQIIKTDKGFFAVCKTCNKSVHGATAAEADDAFAVKYGRLIKAKGEIK